MRVGWLFDRAAYVGGAELTMTEFAAAKPDDVELVDCPHGSVDPDCDRYVLHNCVTYTPDEIRTAIQKPTFKYWNDVGPWIDEEVRKLLDEATTQICCSPLQAEYMGLDVALLIPPPVPLDEFRAAAEHVNGDRRGAVCVGSWRNHGKGAHNVARWAAENNTTVEYYGAGPFAPPGAQRVEYADMPDLLAQHEVFVHLPDVIEPFGRCIAEAWAAGCTIVTNELVGAKWYITENPEAMDTAAATFWDAVLGEKEPPR
jgi:hypothetical protein